ncbi:ABC transporter substrate-binding protein, partial [Staphylococcus aureus]|uniref:ABC transporter substrate-binding protein n=1 Tax=Staphylococcus aureus TaxID=1280 RepID=UPI001E487B6F
QLVTLTKSIMILLVAVGTAFSTMTAQEPVKLGFIPLTDCSPIVMAKELGLFKKYGVEVIVTKESSWANVRDKILTGELD